MEGVENVIRIRCVVERITYQNPENGYSVLKVAVKGYDDLVTVVGNLVDAVVGSVLLIDGDWKIDKKYGNQFVAEKWEETVPATVSRACRMGTPEERRVASVLAKRAMQTFSVRGPNTGTFRPIQSQILFPN